MTVKQHAGSGVVFYLTGVHANDPGQLEILLGQAHALGLMGDVALAHLPALLVLDHTEHSECPVLPCSHPLAMSTTLGAAGGGGGGGGGGAGGNTLRQLTGLQSCAVCCVSC